MDPAGRLIATLMAPGLAPGSASWPWLPPSPCVTRLEPTGPGDTPEPPALPGCSTLGCPVFPGGVTSRISPHLHRLVFQVAIEDKLLAGAGEVASPHFLQYFCGILGTP